LFFDHFIYFCSPSSFEILKFMIRKLLFSLLTLVIMLAASAQESDTLKRKPDKSDIPQVTMLAEDLESDEQTQEISGLLQSSDDIYVSTAGFVFGQTYYKIRGYESEYNSVLMNGISLNDMETGRAFWSAWGGLNDVTRNQEVETGIASSRYSFGQPGGVTNMITRASSFSKQIKFTYSLTNRNYRNRLMFLYSTGLMKNGWAVTASGSKRWAEEGYVEGTFYDAYSYFLSVEKKLNKKHSIGFVGFGSPNKHGRNGASVQKAYDLAGSNYYNPYWGYQNGEKRNSSISNYHQPMMVLSHYWTLNEKTKLTSSVYYAFGRGGSTRLDWYDAADPRPDYYRNLPSDDRDFKGLTADQREYLWINDESFRQLDFDFFYFVNSKNLYTMYNVDGAEGSAYTGNLSNYIIEDRRNDKYQKGININLQESLNDHIQLSTGVNLDWFKTFQFKVVDDLLGGDFYHNWDKFAERDYPQGSPAIQNDLNHPNQVIKEGDKFGYDYTGNINTYNIFAQADFKYNKIEFFAGGTVSYTEFWRTGNMRNGKFPNDSYGDSKKETFTDFGLKAGGTYKITGRHLIDANVMYMTRAPYFRATYISPRTRNEVVGNLTSEKILSGDLSYLYRSPYIKARATVYYTEFTDQIYSRSFYHEVLRSFGNFQMTGIDKIHWGTELGIEGKVTQNITLFGVLGMGQYYYNSNPIATITVDNTAEVLDNRQIYLKGYFDGGFPQTAASAGIKYYSSKNIFGGININYYDDIYLDLNPDRRSAEAVANYGPEYAARAEVLDQEKTDPGFTLDANIGKSWYIKRYFVSVSFSISNILDTQDLAIGGYEQWRYDPFDMDKFPPFYFYLYGRQFFLNINFRF
jgi:hypothetical protein